MSKRDQDRASESHVRRQREFNREQPEQFNKAFLESYYNAPCYPYGW